MKRNRSDGIWDGDVATDAEHQSIHAGVHYVVSDIDTSVDINAPKYWRVTTADTNIDCHLIFCVSASSAVRIELFENPTITGAGTALSVLNSNRGSTNTASLTAFYDTTVSADGTRLYAEISGTVSASPGGRTGGASVRDAEYELKTNEDYIIKVTPIYNATQISLCTRHYEIAE